MRIHHEQLLLGSLLRVVSRAILLPLALGASARQEPLGIDEIQCQLVARFARDDWHIQSATFRPDGSELLVSALVGSPSKPRDAESVLAVLDVPELRLKKQTRSRDLLGSIAASPDGQHVAVDGLRKVFLYNSDMEGHPRELPWAPSPDRLIFSPDNEHLYGWSFQHGATVRALNLNDAPRLLDDTAGSRSWDISFPSSLMAAGGPEGLLRLMDVRTGEILATASHDFPDPFGSPGYVSLVRLSDNGEFAASVTEEPGDLRVWRVPDCKPLWAAPRHSGLFGYGKLCFSPAGDVLACTIEEEPFQVGSEQFSRARQLRFYWPWEGWLLGSVNMNEPGTIELAFSPNGKFLVMATGHRWAIVGGEPERTRRARRYESAVLIYRVWKKA